LRRLPLPHRRRAGLLPARRPRAPHRPGDIRVTTTRQATRPTAAATTTNSKARQARGGSGRSARRCGLLIPVLIRSGREIRPRQRPNRGLVRSRKLSSGPQTPSKLLSECNTLPQPFTERPQRPKRRQMLVFFASLNR
jgi:hypothetical protein